MALMGIYSSVIACVRDKCSYSDYLACPGGVKQGCLLSPLMFSFFINELAIEMSKTGKHGIQLIPGTIKKILLLFADDVILPSNTIVGLQNQLDSLKREEDRLCLTVNLEEEKNKNKEKTIHYGVSYGWSPRYTRKVVVW